MQSFCTHYVLIYALYAHNQLNNNNQPTNQPVKVAQLSRTMIMLDRCAAAWL